MTGAPLTLGPGGRTGQSSVLAPPHAVRHLALLALLVFGAMLIKNPVWELEPQIFNDSPGYLVPALNLLAGRGYGVQQDGFRQPTFPLYLALLLAPLDRSHLTDCTDAHRAVCIGDAAKFPDGELALRVIVTANLILGIAILVLLYALGWNLTHSFWVAVLFGAGYALNIATAFWEISILTETLTTFGLLVAVSLTLRGRALTRRALVLLGAVLAALALCAQLYMFYPVVPAGYLIWQSRRAGLSQALARAVVAFIIPAAGVLLWSTWNLVVNGVFTPSTVGGYGVVQMVYPVIQNAPEGYDGITQTLVAYRDAQIQQTGNPTGAVHRAWRDMIKETDLSYSQVSAKLTLLAFYLIWHYPKAYLSAVGESGSRFWSFAFFHYAPVPPGLAAFAANWTDASLQALLNLLFGCAPLVFALIAFVQFLEKDAIIPRATLAGVVWLFVTVCYAAVFSSLTNLGDNERYRVTVLPLQYGVVVVSVWACFALLKYWVKQHHGAPLH